MTQDRILALSGGVGGAKLAVGLAACVEPDELVVVCNTGDDFEHLGLHISPDLDSVMYALAQKNDEQRGWGRADEGWRFMESLRELGGDDWFSLGDRDLATHVERTQRLHSGATLSQATTDLCTALGIRHSLAPMSDHPVRTIVSTDQGPLAFQHYFVRERCEPSVTGFHFEGIDHAQPSAQFAEALDDPKLGAVIICPSNPFVSVDPILQLPGVTDQLRSLKAPVIAVSPIVGGEALKGPAAKMMQELGFPTTATEVARFYTQRDLLTGFVLDEIDAELEAEVRAFGVALLVTQTVMRSQKDRRKLAEDCLAFSSSLRR